LNRPETLELKLFTKYGTGRPVLYNWDKKVNIHIPKASVELHFPFGPRIMKARITDNKIKELNNLCDDILQRPDKVPYNDYLAGVIKEEYNINLDDLKSIDILDTFNWFAEEFINQSRAYYATDGEIAPNVTYKVKINDNDTWFNDQATGEYNPPHSHTNTEITNAGDAIISVVVYLKIPEMKKRNFGLKDGSIIFIHHSSAHKLDIGSHQFNPNPGDVLIFPGHLTHMVMPYIGKENIVRRSLAYNAHYSFNEY